MAKKTAYIISHTHWDREWYMSFEKHRFRLVELFDSLLNHLESDPDFKHFHFDGQSVVYEDYLAIKPYKIKRIRENIRDGRLSIGPWYVLQDAFLISGEANVRNLLIGLEVSRYIGRPQMIGYFPDTFNNISQAPQILKGFEIDCAIFGRGLPAMHVNDSVSPPERKFKSEIWWQSPDKSCVLGIWLANWYDNCMYIPKNTKEAIQYVKQAVAKAEKFATTSNLLLMNGCDHTPCQLNVGKMVKKLNQKLKNIYLLHSSLDRYCCELEKSVKNLDTWYGELLGDRSKGSKPLAETAGSRTYLKQQNFFCQRLIERWAEPMSSISSVLGESYPTDHLKYAWKTLLKNHAHDSICGCSVDIVHREMELRFSKVMDVGGLVLERAMRRVSSAIDWSFLKKGEEGVLIVNTNASESPELISFEIEISPNIEAKSINIKDALGGKFISECIDLGIQKRYVLPEDKFRRTYNTHVFHIDLLVPRIPSLGWKGFSAVPSDEKLVQPKKIKDLKIKNQYLTVAFLKDGSFSVEDLENGNIYKGLNRFVDIGETGDGYHHVSPKYDAIFSTEDTEANVALYKHSWGKRAVVRNILELPIKIDGEKRSKERKQFEIISEIKLINGLKRVDIKVEFYNNVMDHEFHSHFPTGINEPLLYAETPYDITQRRVKPWIGWQNPNYRMVASCFVDIIGDGKSFGLATRGLYEFELLRDKQKTLAITLVRAVGKLGDWFYFQTEDSQCQRKFAFEYAIFPHSSSYEEIIKDVEAYRNPPQFFSPFYKHNKGHLSSEGKFISLEGEGIVFSALKKAEDDNGLILRFWNCLNRETEAVIKPGFPVKDIFRCNLAEKRNKRIKKRNDLYGFSVCGKEIVTIRLVL